MSIQNNLLEETLLGVEKLFSGENIEELELEGIKNYLCGFTSLVDMTDFDRQQIREATSANIHEIVREAFKRTILNSYRIRYGITN